MTTLNSRTPRSAASLFGAAALLLSATALTPQPATAQDVVKESKAAHLQYLLSFPKNYRADATEGYPLLLFLHGGDGSNTRHNPKKYAAQPDFPFIVVSPQLGPGQSWQTVDLDGLLREVTTENRVDRSRIYLTGYSMGGYGAWDLLAKHPAWFAAAAPIAGGGDPAAICKARDVAVQAFHGDQDNVVPLSQSKRMIDALKACGAEASLTVYPGVNHGSWIPAFKSAELYAWFLRHRRKQ